MFWPQRMRIGRRRRIPFWNLSNPNSSVSVHLEPFSATQCDPIIIQFSHTSSLSLSLSLSFTHTVSKSYSVSLSGMLILFLLCHSFPILSYHLHMFFTYNSASIFKRFFAFSSKTAAVAFEPQVLKRCWPLCCYDQKLVFHFGNPRPLFVYFCIFKQERCGHRKQIGVNDGIWAHNLSIMSPLS